jgi:hypothetical protein
MKVFRLESLLQDLLDEITSIRERRDVFSRHVFESRRFWKEVVEHRRGKDLREIEGFERYSYGRAKELGYKGAFYEWRRVLEAGQ